LLVAVTAQGKTLDSAIDPRFGRSSHLVIVDTETLEAKGFENPNLAASGGAGIQTAQMLCDMNVEAVITGNVGPNAIRTLSASGITVYTDAQGSVRSAVDNLKEGKLRTAESATVDSHFGMGRRRY